VPRRRVAQGRAYLRRHEVFQCARVRLHYHGFHLLLRLW
jgi:hypothetical protein